MQGYASLVALVLSIVQFKTAVSNVLAGRTSMNLVTFVKSVLMGPTTIPPPKCAF